MSNILEHMKYAARVRTLEDLADYLEVSPATLYNWRKNNSVPLWVLQKLGMVGENIGG